MGQKLEEKPLQVFSVSARAFNAFVKEDETYGPRHGFYAKANTGVPALRDALISTTWELRETNARAFNNDAQKVLARLKVWSSDTSADFKMAADNRKVLEDRSNTKVSLLWKVTPVSSTICVPFD